MNEPTSKYWRFLVCAFLVLLIVLVYWPLRSHTFVKYDDDKYVTENRNVNSGLSLENIKWAFTTSHASNWHPLTWLSHMLDCEIFGQSYGAHHLVNLTFHIANTLLLFIVFHRMTKSPLASVFIAALFALHPLHVESVAWIAERKDLLSTFFWILTMWAYARYVGQPKPATYLLTFLFFALGLMAKPMLVTLPFVLLLLDYWPLERFELDGDFLKRFGRLVFEKLPFFVLSVTSSVVTFFVQRAGGSMVAMESFDPGIRIGNAAVSYIQYIGKMFWPVKLAVLYPHTGAKFSMPSGWICAAIVLLLTVCFIYLGQRRKYFTVGWLWYLGTLVPVIGLVQVGVQAMADRYTYIPLTGLFVIIVFAAAEFIGQIRWRKIIAGCLALIVIAGLSLLTHMQLKHWRDSATLFKHTLKVTRNNHIMLNNYATFLKGSGQFDLAIGYFTEALKLKPDSAEVHNNFGDAMYNAGRIDEGIKYYKKAISLNPQLAAAHYNLAIALAQYGKTDEAINEYKKAIEIRPENLDTLSNLAYLLAEHSRTDEAIAYYEKTLAIEPNHIITHGRLGLALAALGKTDEAIEHFLIVLKAKPYDFEMHCNLGILFQRQGDIEQAAIQYRKTLQIKPDYKRAAELLKNLSGKN